MALMNNGTSFNPEHNNRSAHTPHLLDAPVQGAHAQSSNQLAPSAPVMVQQQQQNQDFKPLNSPSQKSSSIGDDEEFDVKSANNSPMRIFVREILDNAPMDLEMGLVTRHKDHPTSNQSENIEEIPLQLRMPTTSPSKF